MNRVGAAEAHCLQGEVHRPQVEFVAALGAFRVASEGCLEAQPGLLYGEEALAKKEAAV